MRQVTFVFYFMLLLASGFSNEKLVGSWKPNLEKVKASKAFKDQGSPQYINMFAKITADFTKEGDLIQKKSGKVMMKLKYKVVAVKGDSLHIAISMPGEEGSEYYVFSFKGKDEMIQTMADKDFKVNNNDLPMIFERIKK